MTEGRSLRVMLVDDHHLVRSAVAQTLERAGIDVTAQVGSAEEALANLAEARPDLVLVDIDLPGMNGVGLVRELVPRLPGAIVIVLTGSAQEEQLMTALRAGAAGYLTKELSPDALVRAVLGALEGDLPMSRRMATRVVRELLDGERRRKGVSAPSEAAALSAREREVLALVSDGLTDRAIADRLGISPRTVGHHLGSILTKLGVSTRAAAARAWRLAASEPGTATTGDGEEGDGSVDAEGGRRRP